MFSGIDKYFLRELIGQPKLVNHAERINARFAAITKDFDDHAFAVLSVGRKSGHFDNDFVADPAVLGARISDQNAGFEDVSIHVYETEFSSLAVGANKTIGVPLDDPDDTPRGSLFAIASLSPF